MPEQLNITNLPSSRVEFIDPRTGLMSREWYRFFLNLFTLTGGGNNQTSLDDLQLAPPFTPSTGGGGSGTVTSVDVSGGTTGLTTTGGPITTSGTITFAGILNIANGGTGASTAAGAPFALKGANADITSLSGLTGAISSPTYVQFGSGSGTTLAAGRMWYDQTTGSLNFGMGNGNITQQVGEETFMYGKASAAITDSPLQIIYHTGTVGASGVITFAPTIAGITNVNDIIGVATESLALNDFGRVTAFGVVRGITTNGTAFGETWVDDDVIWYNPVTGNPTKVEPVAPNIKVQIGTVINAGSGGSGSFQVLLRPGSVLGGTDSNVQFGTLANNNLIAYDSTLGYWKNVTASSIGLGTVTSVAATVPSFLSVTGSPITTSGTLAISYSGTPLPIANGGTATATPALVAGTNVTITGTWPNQTINSSNPGGTVTSVAASVPSFLSVTGSPITSSGTLAIAYSGTALPILNGGTGQTTANTAFNALAPSQTSNSGKYLTTDGTDTSWASVASSTTNAYAFAWFLK